MNGGVAVAANSPVFMASPRPRLSPIFCKTTASSSSSPSPSPSRASPSSPSPLSPFTLRLQQQPTNLFSFSNRFGNTRINKNEAAVCSASPATETLLKRKRPARIDIPIEPLLSFDSVPADGERINEVEAEGEGYAVYCRRGKRRWAMEDRHSAVVGLPGHSKQAIFGVFDGHGGAKAAEFAAKNLNENIMNEVARRSGECIEEAIKEGYLATDAECLKEDINGGTCCVTALIQQGNLVVSNAGDCRAVLSRGGVAEALTVDHRPSRREERERIEGLVGQQS